MVRGSIFCAVVLIAALSQAAAQPLPANLLAEDENAYSASYVEFEDEGHYWGNWEPANRQRLLDEIGGFLAEHLGGTP